MNEADAIWERIAPFFRPPTEHAGACGDYRTVLEFYDGTPVETPADWRRRRDEILAYWHEVMGPWPELIERPSATVLEDGPRENFRQKKLRLEIAPGVTDEVYLLVPEGEGPFPAVVVLYYEPETAAGLNDKALRDFAYALVKRGFVALSMGRPEAYPTPETRTLQRLSFHAYMAANGYNYLTTLPEVDARLVGVTGHSLGGKMSMFASCLYEKFACGVWSDGGIVWDEARPNVNYWEPWYLGWEPGFEREKGVVTPERPRTGAYRRLLEEGHDLHELHALMAPRPFLVSGGAEDQLERWLALNRSLEVNTFLGHDDRVAMTTREGHSPTAESNEQMYLFFEYFLKHGKALVS